MFTGAIAIARVEGQISLVQVVQSGRSSTHVEVVRYSLFGDRTFLANITSSPPTRLSTSDILQFLPSSVQPAGDMLTLPNDVYSQFIACATANQQELDAKWGKAVAHGASLRA